MHIGKATLRSALVLTLLSAPLVSSGFAATATNTFGVSASVTNSCTVSGSSLAFGGYDPTSASPLDSTSTVTVLCTLNDNYTIRLNKGAKGSSVTSRQMVDGTNTYTLNYALYRDSARTQNWGETDNTDTVGATGNGANQLYTVYGRIASGQNVPATSYSDTVTVTVNF